MSERSDYRRSLKFYAFGHRGDLDHPHIERIRQPLQRGPASRLRPGLDPRHPCQVVARPASQLFLRQAFSLADLTDGSSNGSLRCRGLWHPGAKPMRPGGARL